eukprot:440839_1
MSQFEWQQIYLETLRDPSFELCLLIGLVSLFLVKRWSYYMYDRLWIENNKSLPQIEFAGYIMSFLHSIVLSSTSISIMLNYKESTISRAHPSETLLFIYKMSSTYSVAYFLTDIIDLILFYDHKNLKYKLSFIVHHILVLLSQMTVYKSNPYVIFISAYSMFVEVSTIFLNIRMFGKMFNNALMFKVGGIGTLITYPFTRIIFMAYNMYMIYYSKIDYFLCFECKWQLIMSCIFVLMLSGQYYIFVMLKKPKNMYTLKTIKKKKK